MIFQAKLYRVFRKMFDLIRWTKSEVIYEHKSSIEPAGYH